MVRAAGVARPDSNLPFPPVETMLGEKNDPGTLESLLVHEGFVRGVARAVLRGDPEVDDVVQETWVAALDGGPDDSGSLRGWLRRVARNGALRVLRSRRRRDARIRAADRPAAPPTATGIAERESARRRLLDVLLSLGEPSRTALLLRFYEDLPPRAIALRLDVPVETVKTRLRRGLAEMRRRLDADAGGDRRAWAAALLLLLPGGRSAPGGVSARLPTLAAGLVVLLVLAGAGWWLVGSGAPGRGARAPAVRGDPALSPRAAPGLSAAAADPGPSAGPEPALPPDLAVRVIDAITREPLPGATLRAGEERTTDEAGRAALVRPFSASILDVSADGHFGARRRLPAAATELEIPLYPLARFPGGSRIEGTVVAPDGSPAGGARVVVQGLGASVSSYEGMTRETVADPAGHYEILVPFGWCIVRARHPEYGAGAVWAPGSSFFGSPAPLRHADVRLGPAPRLPVRIRPAGGAYTLAARSLEADGGTLDLGTVRDGVAAVVPDGLWALSLTSGPGGPAVTPAVVVRSLGTACFRVGGWPRIVNADARVALRELSFEVEDGVRRIRVTEDGRPVVGALVTLEPAGEADPFVRRDTETQPPHGLRGAFLTGGSQIGRRARAGLTREGRTGEDGLLSVPGWAPSPALVRVRREGFVERFVEVPAWPADGAPVEVPLRRGAVLAVRLPEWLPSISLRRTSDDRLLRLERSQFPLTLEPGEYVIRSRVWLDRDRDAERVLFGPFAAVPGGRVEADLSTLEPTQTLVVRFDAPHAVGRVGIGPRGAWNADRTVGDGVEERTVGSLLWPKFLFRYVDSAGAVHTLYTTRGPFNESDRLATGVRMSLDVSGAGEDAELSIVNRTGIAMGLSLHCASPAAESAESLEVAFVVPERVDSRIGLRDLLPGTYSVWAEDPEATVEPATVEVRRGAATSETLTLRRRAARFVLTPADPALAGKDLARGHILLRPSSGTGSPGARAGATVDDRGEADVVRVAPGRYRVRYTYPFDMEFVPMGAGGGEIGRPKWVELGEVEIPEGVSEHALRVPPKSASKADPVRPAPGPR